MKTQILNRPLEPKVYEPALDRVVEVVDVDVVGIYLVDEDENEAVLQAHKGYSEDFVRRFGRIRCREGVTWLVIKSGEAFVTGDVRNETRTIIPPSCGEQRFNSMVSLPIRFGGEVIGVVHFISYKRDYSDPRKVDPLFAVGNQIGAAIAQARLYEVKSLEVIGSINL